MKKKEKEIILKFLIDKFKQSTVEKIKNTIRSGEEFTPKVFILTEHDEELEVVVQDIPALCSLSEDNIKDEVKSIAIKLAMEMFLKFLMEEKHKLVYLIHSEVIDTDMFNEDHMLFVLEKDLQDNDKDIINNFYRIKRKESHVDENGEVVLGEIDFVEAKMKL